MREFHLFIINKQVYYKDREESLYNILYELNNMKGYYNYGVSLYKQICKPFDVELISKYLNDKYRLNKKDTFYINNVLINLKPSRIIIKSPYNLPSIMKIFNFYNRNILVCDFKNGDYFWLNDIINGKLLEYI